MVLIHVISPLLLKAEMFPTPTAPPTTDTSANVDFANVFLQTHSSVALMIMLFVGLIGAVTAWIQLDRSNEESAGFLFVVGAITALVGVGLYGGLTYSNTQIRTQIAENMVKNVQTKYGAKLDIDVQKDANKPNSELTQHLDQPKQYNLVFPDGVSASYKIYFKDTSEPVVVEDKGAPTAKELNQGK